MLSIDQLIEAKENELQLQQKGKVNWEFFRLIELVFFERILLILNIFQTQKIRVDSPHFSNKRYCEQQFQNKQNISSIEMKKKHEKYMESEESTRKMAMKFQQQLIFGIDCHLKKKHLFGDSIFPAVLCLAPEHESLVCLMNIDKGEMGVQSLYNSDISAFNFEPNSEYPYEITLKENKNTLDMLFSSQSKRNKIYQSLLNYKEKLEKQTDEHEKFHSNFLKYFVEFNTNQDMYLEKSEINHLIDGLNLDVYTAHSKLAQIIEFQDHERLGIESFKEFMMLLECKQELYDTFCKFSGIQPNSDKEKKKSLVKKYLQPSMKQKDFYQFQKQEQGEVYYHLSEKKEKISFNQFCRFLVSDIYNLFYEKERIDSSHPLTHYYVHSSHNTYLIGNQLTSSSNAKLYYKNLKNGVRCMELDIHDGSGGPIIKHGFTLTASIPFEEAIKEINWYSNKYPDHTPIILSFQNHCGLQNQEKMAKIVTKYLKDKLYFIPVSNPTNLQHFPTLEELIGKVVIQGTGNIRQLYKQLKFISTGQKNLMYMLINHAENRNMKEIMEEKKSEMEVTKVTEKKLSRLFSILVEPEWELDDSCWQMANIAENKIEKMMSDGEVIRKIQKYSQKSFIRVYPFGMRVGSSNFNPLPMMQCGAQLISLNTQNYDPFHTCFKSRFYANHNCGYELKTPEALGNKTNNNPVTFKIEFMSINFLVPEFPENSYQKTNIKICYLSSLQDMKHNSKFRSEMIFSEEFSCRTFSQKLKGIGSVNYPSLSITSLNKELGTLILNIGFCGSTGIPLKILKQGYRCVPLYDTCESLRVMGNILIHTIIIN